MKVVLDTNVIVAAFRSPEGASAAVLRMARSRRITLLLSTPLFFEYESQCTLPLHRRAANATVQDTENFLRVLALLGQPVELHFDWKPQLRDPGDEMVLATAANGNADLLVTFNTKDFGKAPGLFGVEVLTPVQLVQRFET